MYKDCLNTLDDWKRLFNSRNPRNVIGIKDNSCYDHINKWLVGSKFPCLTNCFKVAWDTVRKQIFLLCEDFFLILSIRKSPYTYHFFGCIPSRCFLNTPLQKTSKYVQCFVRLRFLFEPSTTPTWPNTSQNCHKTDITIEYGLEEHVALSPKLSFVRPNKRQDLLLSVRHRSVVFDVDGQTVDEMNGFSVRNLGVPLLPPSPPHPVTIRLKLEFFLTLKVERVECLGGISTFKDTCLWHLLSIM